MLGHLDRALNQWVESTDTLEMPVGPLRVLLHSEDERPNEQLLEHLAHLGGLSVEHGLPLREPTFEVRARSRPVEGSETTESRERFNLRQHPSALCLTGLEGVPRTTALPLAPVAPPAHLFEARSNASGGSTMDIVVREVERRPRASVLDIEIRAVGSSVGSSFFVLCSIRMLAQQRGGYRFVVKAEEHPRRGQMLVGFLRAADEPPANADAAFRDLASAAQVVPLEQFAPICDAAK